MFRVLEDKGMLKEPDGKKLSGHKGLFEIRVKVKTNWRLFYAYALEDKILLLHLINKKTQKTPVNEINLAKKRLREYE